MTSRSLSSSLRPSLRALQEPPESLRTGYAWVLAMLLSGIPSTLHAFITGADIFGATRAAGEMVVDKDAGEQVVFAAALVVHGAISLFWTIVLRRIVPRSYALLWAALSGVLISVLDLLVIGKLFFPSLHHLAFLPQLGDHIAFAMLALSVPRLPRAIPQSPQAGR